MSLGGFGPTGGGAVTLSQEILNIQRPETVITGAGFRDVATFTLPGGTLDLENFITVTALFRRNSGTGTIAGRLRYGGTTIAQSGFGTGATSGINAWLWNLNQTNINRGEVGPLYVANQYSSGAAGIDSTVDQDILISVDFTTDSDQITCQLFYVVINRIP